MNYKYWNNASHTIRPRFYIPVVSWSAVFHRFFVHQASFCFNIIDKVILFKIKIRQVNKSKMYANKICESEVNFAISCFWASYWRWINFF